MKTVYRTDFETRRDLAFAGDGGRNLKPRKNEKGTLFVLFARFRGSLVKAAKQVHEITLMITKRQNL